MKEKGRDEMGIMKTTILASGFRGMFIFLLKRNLQARRLGLGLGYIISYDS